MKLISWNVNGLRACLEKGFVEFINKQKPDVICLQETKMQPNQAEIDLEGYEMFFNSAEKKGYSGTAVFTRQKPVRVKFGLGLEEHDHEGRVITVEFDEFYLINVYTPNSQRELLRLDYRMKWEDAFREYAKRLNEIKPVVICGDLNVAHKEIDLKNPKTNLRNAGFTMEERDKLSCLLDCGFIDSFRFFHPDDEGVYSWWSYRFKAREKNAGWRIDYFLVSEKLRGKMKSANILTDVLGSDHCPVVLELK